MQVQTSEYKNHIWHQKQTFENAGKHFTTQVKDIHSANKKTTTHTKNSEHKQKTHNTNTKTHNHNGNSFLNRSHIRVQLHYLYVPCKYGC